tara:strand:+ start:780 stop:1418 length:639 start_codon:yes stop_codon:yes gene_type:complete
MMAKKMFQLLIFIISSSNIFSQSKTLWDFGVIINEATKTNSASVKSENIHSISEYLDPKINAVIADPFIKPNKFKIKNETTTKFDQTKINLNIAEIKSISEESYFSKNYQNIINMIQNQDLESLSDEDYIDLNYLLVESLYHTGKFQKAKKNILRSFKRHKSDRLYFLLSMIYEALDEQENAKNSYMKLITLYPDSDYFNSAKIKTHILKKN